MVCILLLAMVCPAFCLPQIDPHSCCHHCGSAMHAAVQSPVVVLPVTLAPSQAVESALDPSVSYVTLTLAQSKVAPAPPKALTVLRI
jgi:hypothetical protein